MRSTEPLIWVSMGRNSTDTLRTKFHPQRLKIKPTLPNSTTLNSKELKSKKKARGWTSQLSATQATSPSTANPSPTSHTVKTPSSTWTRCVPASPSKTRVKATTTPKCQLATKSRWTRTTPAPKTYPISQAWTFQLLGTVVTVWATNRKTSTERTLETAVSSRRWCSVWLSETASTWRRTTTSLKVWLLRDDYFYFIHSTIIHLYTLY